ncbi:hypothetical protein BJY00DRAFT_326749 [Aspergillus carlsbadensis]|nr:hypothetical protein BJY00DRAFT_326749 [Aspergillus carlsbadensis]
MAPPLPHGYQSTTEYQFDDEQADAIVQTVAYHRRDYGLSAIRYSPREHSSVQPSLATSFPRDSPVGLGSLDQLPLELLFEALYLLDLESLFRFRQVNLRSRHVVDSLKQYQRVVSHGLNLFCALLRTRLAIHISLLDLYSELCNKTCSICGEFAGFISILAWKRCCFRCLERSPETQVRTLASVRKHLETTRAELRQLRSFKSLPGIYTMNESAPKTRVALVSLHKATLICGREARKLADMPWVGFDRGSKFNFMGACALPFYDEQTDQVDHGVCCAGCQLALEKDILPRFDTVSGFAARDKVYARDGFLEHFRWCEQAQLLWESSDGGRAKPPELPNFVRTRGFFKRRN